MRFAALSFPMTTLSCPCVGVIVFLHPQSIKSMRIHLSDPAFLTGEPHLWRVPQFSIRRPRIRRTYLDDLGRITFLDVDEDALVAFWPGQPLRCHQCGVTSEDVNPDYAFLMATKGEDYGLPPYGCEHIEEVVELVLQRCQDGEG